jgi:UDP-N-acetylglucosamine--N-acetylmuramyl-(pentapeptide) pyrophosphoryl-undecaprenol N-acetylglucosamine transferase
MSETNGSLRVAIAGGGTGGHLFPALAVAEELLERDPKTRIMLFGSTRGIERSLDVDGGIETVLLKCPRSGGSIFRLPFDAVRFVLTMRKARKIIGDFRPHVVVGTGGHASVAPALAADAVDAPLMLLEQNTTPGQANLFLSRYADEVHVQFAESADGFPDGRFAAPVHVTGNPVRRSVIEAARNRRPRRRKKKSRPFTLLVMGGSQGARSLNEALWQALPRLGAAKPDMRVFHCAGERDAERAQARLYAAGVAGRAWGFCRVMNELYAEADLAISRAGATAIAELAACGVPAIFVPYPHAAHDHQTANAAVLKRVGACAVVEDGALDGPTLAGKVLNLARDRDRLRRMSGAMRSFARPKAAEVIADRIEVLAGFGMFMDFVAETMRRVA